MYDKKKAKIKSIDIEPFELTTTIEELRSIYKKKYGKEYLIFFVIFEELEIDKKKSNETKNDKNIVNDDIRAVNFNNNNLIAIKKHNQSLNLF